jgi:DMSO reductase family type II enzyme heme b subunit
MNKKTLGHAITFFVASVLMAGCQPDTKAPTPKKVEGILAMKVTDDLAKIGPGSALWAKTAPATVLMLAQDTVDPKLAEPKITGAQVKCLVNTTHMAFRIVWADATRDAADTQSRFSDGAAIQLPTGGGAGRALPDPLMGQPGRGVHIHLWKAAYQQAIGKVWTVRTHEPNATVDHYPSDAAKGADKKALAKLYDVPGTAGNRVARVRTSAVDDLAAHGYGDLTHLPSQVSTGSGAYADGRWTVVISRPLKHPDGDAFAQGDITSVALAIWDGAGKQSGSRKARTAWIKLTLGGS